MITRTAKRADWIPTQEDQLVNLMAVWQVKLADTSLQAAYEWAAADCAAVTQAVTAFTNARTAYHTAPTPPNFTQKDETKRAAIEAMRAFARESVRGNSKMSDSQKQELGVTVADREPSPIPVPEEGPDSAAEISAQAPGLVRVRYLGAKPYGVDRVEIGWTISPAPVDSPDQLPLKETFSRNPWEHTFAHDERGKRLYYSLRYLTTEGASPWSDVRELVVP
ncbi:MAG: hypothetical protein MdMp014T_2212 [Treponematales bacterium]